jgi:hypothetical protein
LRHQRSATPTLIKPALNQLAARAKPTPLRHILQVVHDLARTLNLRIVLNPNFRRALIRRQLTRSPREKQSLHGSPNAGSGKYIRPQRGHREVGSSSESNHRLSIAHGRVK